jgi:hypothetical protein
MKRWSVAIVAACAVALFSADMLAQAPAPPAKTPPATAAKPVTPADKGKQGPQSITVESRPLESFSAREALSRRVGALQFRGALVLTSTSRDFGGLSAIRLDPAGEQFIAISDKANWITGRIVYRERVPVGLADVKLAPMLNGDGRTLVAARRWYDSESLAFDGSIAYVGFERVHQIVRFDFGNGGLLARGAPIAVPGAFRTLPANRGIEALAIAPKNSALAGALIAIAERALDADGNHLGFIIGGPAPGQFTLKRSRDYDVSDAALLPNGDLLVLERKFSLLSGVSARIRRVALAQLVPGALVDGPVLFEADMGYEIDNFEGIDVHRDSGGDIVLTLVSDDNFSFIQRTLLMQFVLVDP